MAIYRGNALQRGHGLGGLFKSLFKLAAPIVRRTAVRAGKKALKTVGRRALKAGANVLTDIADKKATPKEALIRRAKQVVLPPKSINTSKRKTKSSTLKKTTKSKVQKRKHIIAPRMR
jgi:hypothetical protein